jgi:hypothetical protein
LTWAALAALACFTGVAGCERGPAVAPSDDAGATDAAPGPDVVPVAAAEDPCVVERFFPDTLYQRIAYTYDAAARVVRELTTDGDGPVARDVRYTYDGAGRLLTRTRDDGGDGVIDLGVAFAYLPSGLLEREELDFDGDGAPDGVRRYGYNGLGKLRFVEFDADNSGAFNQRVEYTYDELDRLVREETFNFGAVAPEAIVSFTYDPSGRLTVKDEKLGQALSRRDGPSLWTLFRTGFSYDDAGRLLEEAIDFGADGSVDQLRTYAYDASGRLLEVASLDKGADGQPDEVVRHRYDSAGQLVGSEYDLDGDGDIDERVTYDYACWQ